MDKVVVGPKFRERSPIDNGRISRFIKKNLTDTSSIENSLIYKYYINNVVKQITKSIILSIIYTKLCNGKMVKKNYHS